MESCGHYQSQLLDYLYDLLDDEPLQVLEEHLTQCDECRTALNLARGQQRLLASAAKLEFPAVQFVAPPIRLAFPGTARDAAVPRRQWIRWIVAAAVLLAVGGAIPAFRQWNDYQYQQQTVQEADARQQQLLADARSVTDREKTDLASYKARVAVLDDDLRKGNVVELKVPAGEPSAFIGRHTDRNGQPRLEEEVHIEVMEKSKGGGMRRQAEGKGDGAGNLQLNLAPNCGFENPDVQERQLKVQVQRKGSEAITLNGPDTLPSRPVYVTHLATDKPIYQPSERLRFRSLTLERSSLQVPAEELQLIYSITSITRTPLEVCRLEEGSPPAEGKNGTRSVAEKSMEAKDKPKLLADRGVEARLLRGLGAGEVTLDPQRFPEGDYVLTVREAEGRFPPQQRTFQVRKYNLPPLTRELEFMQRSYGPGQEVVAAARARRADTGALLANHKVRVLIKVDDRCYDAEGREGDAEQATTNLKTDGQGLVRIRFRLPTTISRGDATLTVIFDDSPDGTVVRSIPLALKKLEVEFFPEGGYLVAGVPNRIYFQVHTLAGQPAELHGPIVDQDGKITAYAHTLNDPEHPGINQGVGVFELTPQAGKTYRLRIESPSGIEGTHALPVPVADRVALSVPGGVFKPEEPIRVVLRSATAGRSFWVAASCRGRVLAQEFVRLAQGTEVAVELRPAQDIGGVYRITVFEQQGEQLVAVAERLVYRQSARQLRLSVTPDRPAYAPGANARLALQARNENNELTTAVMMLAVVDERVLVLADETTACSPPTYFYLTSELKNPEDLESADFLLSDHARARQALDLLLGTQGWRRVLEPRTALTSAVAANTLDALNSPLTRAALALAAAPELRKNQQEAEEERGAAKPTVMRFEQSDEQLRRQREDIVKQASAEQERYDRERERLLASAAAARADHQQAAQTVEGYQEEVSRLRRIGVPVLGIVLGLLATGLLVTALLRQLPRAIPCYAGAMVCAALLGGVLFLVQGTSSATGQTTTVPETAQLDVPKEQFPPLPVPEQTQPAADKRPLAEPQKEGFGAPGAAKPSNADKDVATMKADRPADSKPEMVRGADPQFQGTNNIALARSRFLDERRRGVDGLKQNDLRGGGLAGAGLRDDEYTKKAQPAADKGSAPHAPGAAPGGAYREAEKLLAEADCAAIREHANLNRNEGKRAPRTPFDETVYWHPALVLPSGQLITVSFDLSEAPTTYRVIGFGHTADGRLGAVNVELPAQVAPAKP